MLWLEMLQSMMTTIIIKYKVILKVISRLFWDNLFFVTKCHIFYEENLFILKSIRKSSQKLKLIKIKYFVNDNKDLMTL